MKMESKTKEVCNIMEKSLEKHPIYWFFGLFVAVCIVLVAVYYATLYRVAPVNNIADSEAFLRSTFARYQDVGNIFQGTIAIAVSLAGTAVAIILAISALRITGRQESNDIKKQILEHVQETRDITQNIITAYKEVEFLAYEFTVVLTLTEINNKYKMLQQVNKLLLVANTTSNYADLKKQKEVLIEQLNDLLPLERMNTVMNNFADALLKIEANLFCNRAYENRFAHNAKFSGLGYVAKPDENSCYYRTDTNNFYIDAMQTIELAIQIKKYTKDFTSEYLLNLISHIDQKALSLNTRETQGDLLSGILVGYLTAPFQMNGKLALLGTLTFYDILCNLPSADDMIDIALDLEKSNIGGNNDIERKLTQAINIILGVGGENKKDKCSFREQVKKRRDLMVKHFDEVLVYHFSTPQTTELTDDEKMKLERLENEINNIETAEQFNSVVAEIQKEFGANNNGDVSTYLVKLNELAGKLPNIRDRLSGVQEPDENQGI